MEKKAITFDQLKSGLQIASSAFGVIGGLSTGGMILKNLVNKINNDASRKRLIEDLALNDPVLKTVDKGTLMEWYASMYNVAPTLSKDKHTVTETLRNFHRFGKVDIQTLKLLADTEKSVADSDSKYGIFGR